MRLLVHLLSGEDLAPRDLTGKSDPYVVLRLISTKSPPSSSSCAAKNDEPQGGEQTKKSRTMPQTLNPHWDEFFSFTVSNPETQKLLLTVKDRDLLDADDPMGHAEIELRNLIRDLPQIVALELLDVECGRLNLTLTADGFGLPCSIPEKDLTSVESSGESLSTHDAVHLREGDVILFHSHNLYAAPIRLITQCYWDHIGIIIGHDDDRKNDEISSSSSSITRPPRILESTERGVRVYDNVISRLDKYPAKVFAARRLSRPLTTSESLILRDWVRQVVGRPYERNFIELVKSVYDGPGGANKHTAKSENSFFCSELVASCFIKMGLLADDPPANEYTPKDFCTKSGKPMPWIEPNISLSKEILISKQHKK